VKLLVSVLLLLLFAPPALSKPDIAQRDARRVEGAETLLEPEILKAIQEQAPLPDAPSAVAGSEPTSDVLIFCGEHRCSVANRAMHKLSALVAARRLPPPLRTIKFASGFEEHRDRTAAVLHVAERQDRPLQIVRGLWSTAAIGDEVAELFGRHMAPGIDVRPFENLGQPGFDAFGIPTTTIVANPSMSNDQAASIAAAAAYFLATLPNAGAEALLSHLTVGAHARLAEDGRKAVAQMGRQQRASADVLIMFGQAIEREQRRMRSFERFMPKPVDPMLRSRIADMEKGITSVWTSMGITSSPFVPAAERIRGRGGEDRRVPTRTDRLFLPKAEPATAFLKFEDPQSVMFELGNFIDGKRSISDIRDAVSAEFGALPLPSVADYFERLAKTGAITLK
jgi:hypothetical protein